jgi:predicted GNAT family acetyltransferase
MAEIVVDRPRDDLFQAHMKDVVVGRARVALGDGVWEAFSTVVEPQYREHGIGARLARALLEAADEAGVTVIPSCWFIDGFITRHEAEFGHLRDGQPAEATGGDPSCRIAPSIVRSSR